MKKVFTILAILIAVVFLALMLVPKFIDWQGKIAAIVRESTGRELRINGEVRVSILPTLKFFASDIHLSNAPGMQEPDLLSIKTISGTLRLWPLLGRRVVIDSFVVDQPSVHLEVDTAGRANWVLGTTTDPSTDSAGQPSPAGTGLPIKDFSLGDARFISMCRRWGSLPPGLHNPSTRLSRTPDRSWCELLLPPTAPKWL